eukprot:EG_transcript_3194
MAARQPSSRGADANTVKVVARFRPLNNGDTVVSGGAVECVSFPAPRQVEVRVGDEKEKHAFEFDCVYAPGARQAEVYAFTGKEIVDDVFKGYNGTIFVYGQTGSGKTHTMMGPSLGALPGYCDDPELKGIIPRVVESVFHHVEAAEEAVEFTLKVSYVEIYMERIRDLLDPKKTNLQLHEDLHGGRGVYVADATEAYVSDVDEVFRLMRSGAANRTVASTRMNDESSRSHSIFQITVTQKHSVKLEQKSGKLFLVDLAGSERAGKTRAEGQQLEEAKLINKSLSTLGMVINALTDKRSTHVPYRDSKLTRLLQDSIGGNSRTTLLVCCSPARANDHETLSTLRFGERAKKIHNKAKINREWTVAELKAMLAKAELQITRLRKMQGNGASGGSNSGGSGESGRPTLELLDLEAEWQEERLKLLEEREELLQQAGEAREEGLRWQQEAAALRVENALLREQDALWEAEYAAVRARLETAAECYEQEKEAHAAKFEAMAATLQFAEDLLGALHAMKAHTARLRQQAQQVLLTDRWAGSDGGDGVPEAQEDVLPPLGEAAAVDRELPPPGRPDVRHASIASEAALLPLPATPLPDADPDGPAPSTDQERLLQELQLKHDSILDLEQGLEEAREAYHKLLYTASNRALKKRLLFLEQQAEQQTESYQELYNENSTLRLEMQLAEKKLAIRNERIENLKAGLKEEKRHLKEVQEQCAAEREKFKAELTQYKEELGYWKAKSLSRDSAGALGKKGKNVVKVLKGGHRPPPGPGEGEGAPGDPPEPPT